MIHCLHIEVVHLTADAVAHPGSNRGRRRTTTLIDIIVLPLALSHIVSLVRHMLTLTRLVVWRDGFDQRSRWKTDAALPSLACVSTSASPVREMYSNFQGMDSCPHSLWSVV